MEPGFGGDFAGCGKGFNLHTTTRDFGRLPRAWGEGKARRVGRTRIRSLRTDVRL